MRNQKPFICMSILCLILLVGYFSKTEAHKVKVTKHDLHVRVLVLEAQVAALNEKYKSGFWITDYDIKPSTGTFYDTYDGDTIYEVR